MLGEGQSIALSDLLTANTEFIGLIHHKQPVIIKHY